VSYELLIENAEPIDGWSVCTVCLSIERTARVLRRRWRCSDCGSDSSHNTQLRNYLTENDLEKIESNLREWTALKEVRAAYKMLRSARYKCLLTLGRRLRGEPAAS